MAVVAAGSAVRADVAVVPGLISLGTIGAVTAPVQGVSAERFQAAEAIGSADSNWDRTGSWSFDHPADRYPSSSAASEPSSANAIILPPAPSSLSLFLSAVLSVGAWHVARSVRDMDLGALPEWYHAEGPDRIGHRVAVDLTFSLAALPSRELDRPTGVATYPAERVRAFRDRHDSQRFLSPAVVRGPPL